MARPKSSTPLFYNILTAPLALTHRPPIRPAFANRRPPASKSTSYHIPRRKYSSQPAPSPSETTPTSTNPPLTFPCLDAAESRTSTLLSQHSSTTGPEPSYTTGAHLAYHSSDALHLDWGGLLPSHTTAYETWGTLNSTKTNAILLFTGLSASSHAKSTPANPQRGWWENFIGPGAPLNTDKYFVICVNVLGSCYGSTGPSSLDPANGERYATHFPVITMEDMVRAQFRLLDSLGISSLYAAVGSSMGGMQSLAAGVLFPHRVQRIATISGCARSHPYSIALRHVQRQALMMDPNWRRGHYYTSAGGIPPHMGLKLAREIATVTYRSGPEWEQRFGRARAQPDQPPALCPDFLIETYLDHAGEKWCLNYDANSFLYISKAMDLFDLGTAHQTAMRARRAHTPSRHDDASTHPHRCTLTLPERPYEEQAPLPDASDPVADGPRDAGAPPDDLIQGLLPLRQTPTLVMGVASDILFPAWQQCEVAQAIRRTGNGAVTHVELGEEQSVFGHDTFLLDLDNVGGALRGFLG